MRKEVKLVNSLRPKHWPQNKVTPDLSPEISAYFRYSLNFSFILTALETLSGINAATGGTYTKSAYSQVNWDLIQVTY